MRRELSLLFTLLILMTMAGIAQPAPAVSECAHPTGVGPAVTNGPQVPAEGKMPWQASSLSFVGIGYTGADSAYNSTVPLGELTVAEASLTAWHERRAGCAIRTYTNADIERVEQKSGLRWPRPFAAKGDFSAGFTVATATPPAEISNHEILLGQHLGFIPDNSPEVQRLKQNLGISDLNVSASNVPLEENDAADPSDVADESISTSAGTDEDKAAAPAPGF